MRPASLVSQILHNRLKRTPQPAWCTFLVTYRCNARCKMCDVWRVKPGDEMTPSDVRNVFAKIGQLDIVRLSGGEPFLRDDLLEIAEEILRASQPKVIHITTNGSFPKRIGEFAERFTKPNLLRFMVSFDGLQPEHDLNRGQDVTFDQAVEAIRILSEIRNRSGIEVSANHTVISAQSMADHVGLRERLQPFGCDVHSVLAYSDSAMYGAKRRGTKADDLICDRYPLHPQLEGTDVIGFVDQQLETLKDYRTWWLRWGKRYYLQGLKSRLALNGNSPAKPKPPCVALRSHLRLLPDGGVPVCQFNTQVVGNLLNQSLEEVWFGDTAKDARKWVDACVGCWAECEVMPNAIYSGDILRLL